MLVPTAKRCPSGWNAQVVRAGEVEVSLVREKKPRERDKGGGGGLTRIRVDAGGALQVDEVVEDEALVGADGGQDLVARVDRETGDGAGVIQEGSDFGAAIKDLHRALGGREDDLGAGPGGAGHGFVDLEGPLQFVPLDRVNSHVAVQAGDRGVASLHSKGRGLGHGKGVRGADLEGRDVFRGGPSFGDRALLPTLR